MAGSFLSEYVWEVGREFSRNGIANQRDADLAAVKLYHGYWPYLLSDLGELKEGREFPNFKPDTVTGE